MTYILMKTLIQNIDTYVLDERAICDNITTDIFYTREQYLPLTMLQVTLTIKYYTV